MTPQPTRSISEAELYTGSVSRLTSLFYDDLDQVGRFEPVSSAALPADYRQLLAHNDHMTVTLEAFHRSLVQVRALAEWRDAASYSRNSLLTREADGAVLQFGIMRLWLGDLPETARQQIAAQKQPLGRVLIEHNVLREVELISLWKIEPGPAIRAHLPIPHPGTIYGRSAQILLDERPTVQMLEIVSVDTGRT